MQPAGQDPEDALRARNGHSTALFAYECQSFLDNLIAGLGRSGAWNDPVSERARFKRCQRFSDFLAVDFRLDSPTARVWIRFPREAGGEIPPAYSPGRPDIPSIHKKWKLL
jgi:hypothetical protein